MTKRLRLKDKLEYYHQFLKDICREFEMKILSLDEITSFMNAKIPAKNKLNRRQVSRLLVMQRIIDVFRKISPNQDNSSHYIFVAKTRAPYGSKKQLRIDLDEVKYNG